MALTYIVQHFLFQCQRLNACKEKTKNQQQQMISWCCNYFIRNSLPLHLFNNYITLHSSQQALLPIRSMPQPVLHLISPVFTVIRSRSDRQAVTVILHDAILFSQFKESSLACYQQTEDRCIKIIIIQVVLFKYIF